jgi:beta-glucosidase/6-phospho-beta-glucosidase/beta-galactosidase
LKEGGYMNTNNLTQEERVVLLQEIQAEQLDMYESKNIKYGNSFGVSVQKYGLVAALTRLSDKFNRLETLILTNNKGTVDESLEDTLSDMATYCNMTLMELKTKK